MSTQPVSRRLEEVVPEIAPLLGFFNCSAWARRKDAPGIADFVGGNPHEPALPGLVEALRTWSVPQRDDWFAYTLNVPAAQATVAEVLRARRGLPFEAEDVFLSTGSFGGLALALRALVDPGDEVLYLTPGWHFYDILIRFAGAGPVRVPLAPPRFDLDLAAVERALGPRTRAIVLNTPHNPTGRVFPRAALEGLARLLERATASAGRAVYLVSDESYCRLVFDGRAFTSPTAIYPRSLLVYTFGKTLLAPGARIGYVVLPPALPDREQVRIALSLVQTGLGYAYPDVVLQYAIGDLERLSIDVDRLQAKRDRLVRGLLALGYLVEPPEATFWLLVRAPNADDERFTELLAEHDVFVLPGTLVGLPGWLRLSLTASEAMIERALPGFAAAMAAVRAEPRAAAR